MPVGDPWVLIGWRVPAAPCGEPLNSKARIRLWNDGPLSSPLRPCALELRRRKPAHIRRKKGGCAPEVSMPGVKQGETLMPVGMFRSEEGGAGRLRNRQHSDPAIKV